MNLLLIEDDERIVEFLVRGLVSEGHQLQVATNGLEGFQQAVAGEWDVIILDLMLPKIDGREICQSLRKMKDKTPILMLTALESTEDVVRGLRMGADDYLTKPFSFDELVARIEILGSRGGSSYEEESTNRIEAGGIVFNRSALKVMRGEDEIDMTSLEYALLEFLMVEAGKVVSRARILQNVWGAHEDPLTNIVDVYIGRLRSKLDTGDGDSLISTIRGRGYRFNG